MVSLAGAHDVKAQSGSYPFLQQYAARVQTALLQNDVSILEQYHGKDIRLMPAHQKTMKGARSVAAYYQALSARFSISKVEFNTLHTYDIDTLLVDQGTFELIVRSKAGGPQQTVKGNYLHLWNLRDRAKPKLITDVWNVKQLPFDSEQLRFRELPTVDVALMAHLPVKDDVSFELAALNRMMEVTVAQHDAVAWTLFYSDNSFLLANNGDYHAGKPAITKYLANHVGEIPVFEKLDIRNDEVVVLKNGYIIEYSSHVANWRYDEHSGVGMGKDLRIWKRQADGRLKIISHIGSYD